MTNGFDEMILNMTDTTPEPEDYTGEDGRAFILREVPQAQRGLFPQRNRRMAGA